MKILRSICEPLAKLLFAALTAYSQLAPAALCGHQLSRTPYFSHATSFMQGKLDVYSPTVDFSQSTSKEYAESIRQHVDEFERRHSTNRIYATTDMAGTPQEDRTLVDANFATVTAFLNSTKLKLENHHEFTQIEWQIFFYMLTVMRERNALVELKKLFDSGDEERVTKRYPGQTLAKIGELAERLSQNISYMWKLVYIYPLAPDEMATAENFRVYHLPTPSGLEYKAIFKGRGPNKILVLPSPFPTGFSAFFRTFHLPVSPYLLATEYELVDGGYLDSPVRNLLHDNFHFENTALRFLPAQGESDATALHRLRVDLDEIEARVKAKGNADLLKFLYYLSYAAKFETGLVIDPSLSGLNQGLRAMFDSFPSGQSGQFSNLFRLQKREHAALAGWTVKRLMGNYAEVLNLISVYLLEKQSQSLEHFQAERAKIEEQHIADQKRVAGLGENLD